MDFLKDKFVAVDLETTGLDVHRDSIIEIGAVRCKNGEIIERFSTFVHCMPEQLSPEIVSLTGITYEQLQNAPKPIAALQRLYDFIDGCVLIAHNFRFDFSFLQNWGFWCNVDFNGFEKNGIDTVALAKEKLAGQVKNYKLSTVAEFLGTECKKQHRALADAETCAKITLEIAKI